MIFSIRRQAIDPTAFEHDHVSYKGVLSEQGDEAIDAPAPQGFNVDRSSIVVGSGGADFASAREALRNWTMFSMPWIGLTLEQPEVELGTVAVVTISALGGITVTNASRVTRIVDRTSDDRRVYGFVYATLHDHAARGEELFMVTQHSGDDRIEFSIVAHSRPNHWLSWVGYPVTRWFQRRFRREAGLAMQAAVHSARSSAS